MAVPADKWGDLQEKLKKLPPEEIEKVADFADFLQSRQKKESSYTPNLKWAVPLRILPPGTVQKFFSTPLSQALLPLTHH